MSTSGKLIVVLLNFEYADSSRQHPYWCILKKELNNERFPSKNNNFLKHLSVFRISYLSTMEQIILIFLLA